MHEEGTQVSPNAVKQNLHTLLGGFISEHRLGQYLDFNVVVIPTGKHVKEFPTADAAFHPYEHGEEGSDAQLQIRIVPWLIVKLSANEMLSRKLHNESHNFWKAGVEQMWEICLWSRIVIVHHAKGKIYDVKENEELGNCPVLPGFSIPAFSIFEPVSGDSLLPSRTTEHSWRIDQSLRTGDRRLTKYQTPEFVLASPEQLQAAASAGEDLDTPRPSASRYIFDLIFHSWPGRIGLLLAGSIVATMIILMIKESNSERMAPKFDANNRKSSFAPSSGIKRELARTTVTAFYKATTVKERLELVRNPARMSARINDYYTVHPLRAKTIRLFGDMEDIDLHGRRFVKLPTWLEEGANNIFLEDLGGVTGFKIDWDSLVGHNDMDLGQFIEEKDSSTESAFRVLASDGGFHGGRFDNPEKWLSIVLNFPDSDKRLYGYVRQKSPLAPIISKLVKSHYKRPVRLRIRWPNMSDFADDPVTSDSLITAADREMTALLKDRQVWITALDGDTWLQVDPE